MKRKELIRRLLEIGDDETEICIDNHDIQSIEISPAYWDGNLQTTKRSCESYIGKYHTKGYKILLMSQSIEDLLWDYDVDIDYSELSKEKAAFLKERNDKVRAEALDIEFEAEQSIFVEWIENYLAKHQIKLDPMKIVDDVTDFFRIIYKSYDLSELVLNKSYSDRLKDWLDNNLKITFIPDGNRMVSVEFKYVR